MDKLGETLRVAAFVILSLVLPQVLGFFGYQWLRHRGILIGATSVLVAPLVFFATADIFWSVSAQSIRNAGLRVCGAFGAAAAFSTMFGTLIHFALSVVAFLLLTWFWKKRTPRSANVS